MVDLKTGSWFGHSRLWVGLVGRRGPKSVQPRSRVCFTTNDGVLDKVGYYSFTYSIFAATISQGTTSTGNKWLGFGFGSDASGQTPVGSTCVLLDGRGGVLIIKVSFYRKFII